MNSMLTIYFGRSMKKLMTFSNKEDMGTLVSPTIKSTCLYLVVNNNGIQNEAKDHSVTMCCCIMSNLINEEGFIE